MKRPKLLFSESTFQSSEKLAFCDIAELLKTTKSTSVKALA